MGTLRRMARRGWLCVVLAPSLALAAAQDDAQSWTWVIAAELEGTAASETAQRIFAEYQRDSLYAGELVHESSLHDAPSGPTVFLGPLPAFHHPEWFKSVLTWDGSGAALGDQRFYGLRTGFYVRSETGRQVLITGLSVSGWREVLTLPTRDAAATVTFEGRVAFLGSYGDRELKLTRAETLQALPTSDELAVELSGSAGLAAAARLTPVYQAAGPPALGRNFTDRVEEIIEGKHVLFFGEEHWNDGINRLFGATLEWLLRERGVSTLFLEHSYSHSAHFQRYVTLGADADADRFWESSVKSLVMSQSTRDLLDLVRLWNRENPGARVGVACLDAEFDYERTLNDALGEYFRTTDASFEHHPFDPNKPEEVLAEVQRLRALLRRPGAPQHPWMRREFVANALTNLEEAVAARGLPSRLAERQRSIIRNVTEYNAARFTDAALERGLVLFKEGGAHAYKDVQRDDGAWWEATFLEQRFEPTRGRVASLMAHALGYDFDGASDVSPGTHKRWAAHYHRMIDEYTWALRAGILQEGRLYPMTGVPPTGIPKLALHTAYQGGGDALLLESFSLPLLDAAQLEVGDGSWNRFDAVIYVVGGSLEPTFRLPR